MRFRVTDLTIQGGGAKPLSVSTNWIGVTALRGARLQHLLRAAGVPVERSGTSGTVLEAYPAAALREWDLQHSGYKRAKNAKARQQLTSAVIDQCGPFASAVEAWLSTRAEP